MRVFIKRCQKYWMGLACFMIKMGSDERLTALDIIMLSNALGIWVII